MFDKQKRLKSLDPVDYAALRRLARQERARYLATLFKAGSFAVGQWIKRLRPDVPSSQNLSNDCVK